MDNWLLVQSLGDKAVCCQVSSSNVLLTQCLYSARCQIQFQTPIIFEFACLLVFVTGKNYCIGRRETKGLA